MSSDTAGVSAEVSLKDEDVEQLLGGADGDVEDDHALASSHLDEGQEDRLLADDDDAVIEENEDTAASSTATASSAAGGAENGEEEACDLNAVGSGEDGDGGDESPRVQDGVRRGGFNAARRGYGGHRPRGPLLPRPQMMMMMRGPSRGYGPRGNQVSNVIWLQDILR